MQPEAYAAQPVWTHLATVRETYENLPTPPDAYASRMTAIGEFIEFIEQFRPGPEYSGVLALDGGVGNLNSYIQSLQQWLAGVDTDQWNQLDTAVSNINGWMQSINQWFGVIPSNYANPAAKGRFTIEVNRLANEARLSTESFKEASATHAEDVAHLKAELDALTQRLAEAESHVEAAESSAKTTLIGQIDSQRSAFTEEVERREARYKEEAKNRAEESRKALEDLLAKAAGEANAEHARAKAIVDHLREFETRSEGLVDSTARNAIAGDYGAWAQTQGSQAFKWTIATIVACVATVVVLLILLFTVRTDQAAATSYLTFKAGIGVVMLAVAGYCASQASQHRHEERTAKRLHLDLAAFEPFLKEVENPGELRSTVAERVFAPEQHEAARQAPVVQFGRGFSVDQLLNLVNAIREKP
jgi:hypothetical protein